MVAEKVVLSALSASRIDLEDIVSGVEAGGGFGVAEASFASLLTQTFRMRCAPVEKYGCAMAAGIRRWWDDGYQVEGGRWRAMATASMSLLMQADICVGSGSGWVNVNEGTGTGAGTGTGRRPVLVGHGTLSRRRPRANGMTAPMRGVDR